MGRSSINWMNPDVQQSIEDYIQRKIPTQAKLRQVISNYLQQPISEQALSIYLKRSGYSGCSRRTNSPSNLNCSKTLNQSLDTSPETNTEEVNSSPLSASIKQQSSLLTSSTIASISSALSNHSLATENFYNQHHSLFINGINVNNAVVSNVCSTSSSTAAVIVNPNSNSVNFVHVSSPATFSNILDMSNNGALRGVVGNTNNCNSVTGMLNLTNDSSNNSNDVQRFILEDSQQHLHRAAEIHNLQLQQQVQWQQQNQQQSNTNNSNDENNGNVNLNSKLKCKRSSNSSQPINWKDPVVQDAITNYFNKKIKLQAELRQVIMHRLKRTISENSLRSYLKKKKKKISFELPISTSLSQSSSAATPNTATVLINDAFRQLTGTKNNLQQQSQQHLNLATVTASSSASICPTSTTMPIISSPSKEFYYLCNNIAGFASQPVAYATSTGTNQSGHHSMFGSIETYDFNDNAKTVHMAPSTMIKLNEHFIKVQNNGGTETADIQTRISNEENMVKTEKDDVKPSVRRRINWGNTEVQNAIQDFYNRKILTQAKLRSIIESILNQVVSEQALSIYLKRKKSRNLSNQEVLLMNISCVD